LVLVGIVWLTAASVLAAGMPRLVCACPDVAKGPTAPSCERCRPAIVRKNDVKTCPLTGHKGCCCCQTKAEQKPGQVKPAQEPANKPTEKGPKLTAPTCIKGLARSVALTSSTHKTDHKDRPFNSLFVVKSVSADSSLMPAASVTVREVGPAPPPDMLTLCHRLLI
jgi:hypothetical protein